MTLWVLCVGRSSLEEEGIRIGHKKSNCTIGLTALANQSESPKVKTAHHSGLVDLKWQSPLYPHLGQSLDVGHLERHG